MNMRKEDKYPNKIITKTIWKTPFTPISQTAGLISTASDIQQKNNVLQVVDSYDTGTQ